MCDDFDIKTLPSNFISVSRPSKIIEKLNEKRKLAHENAIEAMKDKKLKLNLETDEKLKKESDIFIGKLRDSKDEVDSYINNVKFENRKPEEFVNLDEDLVKKPFEKVSSSYGMLLQTVEDFHRVLADIEKCRSDKLKMILKETKNTALSTAHKLPFEIDAFFDEEILELNKITLNNFQNYTELQNELKLQVSQYMKFWTEELLEIKEIQRFNIKEMSKKSVERLKNSLRSDLALISQSDDVADALQTLETLQSDLQWPKEGQIDIPVSQKNVDEWLKDTQKTLASLDLSARNLVSLYKSIIIIVFNRFFREMEELKKTMTESVMIDKKDIEDYQSEIYTPTVAELNLRLESEFENLQSTWEEKINKMKDSAETTYKFLKISANLWDRHFKRVIDLQTCVLLDLENTVENNSQASLAYEAELNIKIEKLRQGTDERKLDRLLADVEETLDRIEISYNVYSDTESQVIQKYRSMMETEIDVLMAEIRRFLTLHPPYGDIDPKIQRKRASQCSEQEIDPRELLVPNQILYCMFQVDATKNWMFGLWEAINNYLSTCKAEILTTTEQWMGKQREKINERLKVKLAFHMPRLPRIQCSIYNKRLNELSRHAERMTSHKMAAEREILTLKKDELVIEAGFSKISSRLTSQTDDLLKKADEFTRSNQLRGLLHTLAPLWASNKSALEEIQKGHFERCVDFLDTLRTSGYQFLKSIKLFSEEGSFSIEEITSLQKHIAKLDDYVDKALQKCMNDVNKKYSIYSGYLDNTYTTTLSTIDEELKEVFKNEIVWPFSDLRFEELIRELEHNEKVVKKIKKLKGNIKSEVVSIKITMKKIQIDAKNSIQKSYQHYGGVRNLKTFIENYHEIIERMRDFASFMGHPDPQPKVVVSRATTVSVQTSRIAQTRSRVDQDHFLSVSQVDQVNPDTFLAKLNSILNDSYMDIRKHAKEFYAKHHTFLLDHSRIQPTQERCMDEVHHKYKKFQQQCEACWHENLNEFLAICIDFQKMKNGYSRKAESLLREQITGRCAETITNIQRELEDAERRINCDFQDMFKRLRTLHGHPKNRTVLEDLQKQFDELEEKYIDIADILIPHKEKLLNVYNEGAENFKQFQETLTYLKNDDKLENLIEDLERRLPYFPSHSCNLLSSGSENNTQNWDPQSHSSTMTSSSSASSTGSEFLEELERTHDTHLQTFAKFVSTHLADYKEDRKTVWTGEIKSIRALYKVKYDDDNL